jgi:hypothetical protein
MGDKKSILLLDAKASFFIVQNLVFDILQFKLCTVHLSIKIFNFGEVATVPALTGFPHTHVTVHPRPLPSIRTCYCTTSSFFLFFLPKSFAHAIVNCMFYFWALFSLVAHNFRAHRNCTAYTHIFFPDTCLEKKCVRMLCNYDVL